MNPEDPMTTPDPITAALAEALADWMDLKLGLASLDSNEGAAAAIAAHPAFVAALAARDAALVDATSRLVDAAQDVLRHPESGPSLGWLDGETDRTGAILAAIRDTEGGKE